MWIGNFCIIIIAPSERPDLFTKWERSEPEIIQGFCGVESKWTVYAESLLNELETIDRNEFQIESYPHTKFKLEWDRFLADRHAFPPNFGCRIGNAGHPSVITAENRSQWENMLWVNPRYIES